MTSGNRLKNRQDPSFQEIIVLTPERMYYRIENPSLSMIFYRAFAKYRRRVERPYTVLPYIAEFWNTISNLPFIFIGVYRIFEGCEDLAELYLLMVLAGVASGFHHATTIKWSIFIDWTPILMTIIYLINTRMIGKVSLTGILLVSMAFIILLLDHVNRLLPVPYGHVLWHVTAAFAIDYAYQSIGEKIHCDDLRLN